MKTQKNNRGYLALGLIVSLSVTLTGFEYMSAETIYTKKMMGKVDITEPDIPYIPDVSKPKMPQPENQQKNNNDGKPVVAPPVIMGPIITDPNPPKDPIVGPWDPNPPKIVYFDTLPPVITDPIVDPDFMEDFPTYEEFLTIKDREERRVTTVIEIKNKVKRKIPYYPEIPRSLGIEGTVWVSFIVNKQGQIEDVKIERGVHPDLDVASIKAVQKLPNMVPGKQMDKPVKVRYKIPIKFTLD